MSLYNMLHGIDEMAPALLYVLGLFDPAVQVARFRDIHINADGSRILMLTRVGGGNREYYADWWEQIRKHPQYVRDYDDDFDSTFAYIEFTVPPWAEDLIKPMATGNDPPSLRELTEAMVHSLREMTPTQVREDPRTKDLATLLEKLVQRMNNP